MATEQTAPRAELDPDPRPNGSLAVWGRPLAIATLVVFVISAVFPVVAGLSKNTAAFPKWWGTLDVIIAFVLALLALAVMSLAQRHVDKQAEDSSYRAYRILIHAIFVMIVVFFVFGDKIVWSNCLTGFAWRSWLLMYGLPAWFAALRAAPVRGFIDEKGQDIHEIKKSDIHPEGLRG